MRHLIIVTGASSGIGRAYADLAHRKGAVTGTTSRRSTAGDHALVADLSDPESWAVLVDWIDQLVSGEPWEEVELLHAAATLTPIGPAGHVDASAYRANVILNSAAPQVIGAGFVGVLNRHGIEGRLIQISSGAARSAYEGWSSYGAGKAAVDHWVRSVGAEQQRQANPVRVVSVAPGVVATGMQEEIRRTPEDRFPSVERFRGLHANDELADPDDVASRLWDAVRDPDLPNGSVIDLRER